MGYIFDPNALQEIVKKNLNLSLEERLDAIIADIDKKYPKRISTKKKWAFTIAGGVAGQLTVLYGSLSEYLLIVGFPVGTEGYSGRFAPLIYDVVIEGEHQTYTLGQTRPTVYLPGDMATLPRGTDKGCLMKPGNWLLEYARGFIAQALPMGMLASSITTMDYRSVRRQFWEYSKICTREILRGHFF
jgi:C-8 sterol isomerase